MVDLEDIKQAAQVTTDKRGKPVVQIPLELWQEWLGQGQKPQHERIREALAAWDKETADLSDEWWDEFQTFIEEHRLDLS